MNGPEPPFTLWLNAAAQLHQTGYLSIVQHFLRVKVGYAQQIELSLRLLRKLLFAICGSSLWTAPKLHIYRGYDIELDGRSFHSSIGCLAQKSASMFVLVCRSVGRKCPI